MEQTRFLQIKMRGRVFKYDLISFQVYVLELVTEEAPAPGSGRDGG